MEGLARTYAHCRLRVALTAGLLAIGLFIAVPAKAEMRDSTAQALASADSQTEGFETTSAQFVTKAFKGAQTGDLATEGFEAAGFMPVENAALGVWNSATVSYRDKSTYPAAVRWGVYWWNRTPTPIHLLPAPRDQEAEINIETVRVPEAWLGLAYLPPDGRVYLNANMLGRSRGSLRQAETAAHEMGHALGLRHRSDGCSLMYPSVGLARRCPTRSRRKIRCGPQSTDARKINMLYGSASRSTSRFKSTCKKRRKKDRRGPRRPTKFRAQLQDGTVVLDWRNPTNRDFFQVRVVHRRDTEPTSRRSGTLVYRGDEHSHIDVAVAPGATYHYAIWAQDVRGNWSRPTRLEVAVESPVPDVGTP